MKKMTPTQMVGHIAILEAQLAQKDSEIANLQDRVEDLERIRDQSRVIDNAYRMASGVSDREGKELLQAREDIARLNGQLDLLRELGFIKSVS